MEIKVRRILDGLRFKAAPAPPAAMAKLRDVVGVRLPNEYLELLEEMNGCEGPIGDANYVMICPIEDVILGQEGDLVHRQFPGVVVFATDGGDVAYAFDTRSTEMSIVETSFSDPTAFPPKVVGRTLSEWLQYLIAFDPTR